MTGRRDRRVVRFVPRVGNGGRHRTGAIRLRQRDRALSAPDAFALLLARREHGILLTGDRRLRNAASAEGVERHGHLWMIERPSEYGIVADRVLVKVLLAWKEDPRVRLPEGENHALHERLARGHEK